MKIRKWLLVALSVFALAPVFSQESREDGENKYYYQHLNRGKKYESEKKWCRALEAYFDAMVNYWDGSSEPPEAAERYNAIYSSIMNGNPGLGEYDIFTVHDEWKKLLLEAEQVGSTMAKYRIIFGGFRQTSLNYSTRTANYALDYKFEESTKYKKVIKVIADGYKKAWRREWNDLPLGNTWPAISAADEVGYPYKFGTSLLYQGNSGMDDKPVHYNAFDFISRRDCTLYDYKIGIYDDSHEVLVEPQRFLLGSSNVIEFKDVNQNVMKLIEQKYAYPDVAAVYLEYGKYNPADDRGGRSFIRNLPEMEIASGRYYVSSPFNRTDYDEKFFLMSRHWKYDMEKDRLTGWYESELPVIKLADFGDFEIMDSLVTNELYYLVMPKDDVKISGKNFPVSRYTYFEAVEFCNRLSEIYERTPVYSLDGTKDYSKWKNYSGLAIDENADGFRLPTPEEWLKAAGGTVEFSKIPGFVEADYWNDWYKTNKKDDEVEADKFESLNNGLYYVGALGELLSNKSYGVKNSDSARVTYKTTAGPNGRGLRLVLNVPKSDLENVQNASESVQAAGSVSTAGSVQTSGSTQNVGADATQGTSSKKKSGRKMEEPPVTGFDLPPMGGSPARR